jgi:hypothetical protein
LAISTGRNLEGTTSLSISSAAQQRAGADGRKTWVLMQRLSAATQLHRYLYELALQAQGQIHPERLFHFCRDAARELADFD